MKNETKCNIFPMSCASVIYSNHAFFIYDRSAGEKMNKILCIASSNIPESFIEDIEKSRIIKKEEFYNQDREYFSFSVLLAPQFGFTNEKLTAVIHQLFKKYNL